MLYIVTDAASRGNPGMASASWDIYESDTSLVSKSDNKLLSGCGLYLGNPISNNIAEYSAVLYAILSVLPYNISPKELTILSDSQLVMRQLSGQYKVNSPVLKPYYDQIKYLETTYYHSITYRNAPRNNEYISECDKRCNSILDATRILQS